MIRVTNSVDGAMVVLNPGLIFMVKQSAAGTSILSAGRETIYVKETLNEVETLIVNEQRKAYAKKKEASRAALELKAANNGLGEQEDIA